VENDPNPKKIESWKGGTAEITPNPKIPNHRTAERRKIPRNPKDGTPENPPKS